MEGFLSAPRRDRRVDLGKDRRRCPSQHSRSSLYDHGRASGTKRVDSCNNADDSRRRKFGSRPPVSQVDYSRLRSLTIRELTRALLNEGFSLIRQRGSHRRYGHDDGRRVTIPFTRSGDTFARGTLKSIIELQAKWTVEDLIRLGLLR